MNFAAPSAVGRLDEAGSGAISARTRFGHDVLGPIVHDYIYRLHAYMSYDDTLDTTHLFCARAGVRIKELYDTFVQNSGATPVNRTELFWISRFLVCKGIYRRTPEAALEYVSSEFRHGRIGDVVKALLRNRPELILQIDFSQPALNEPASTLAEAVKRQEEWQPIVCGYLDETAHLFERYFQRLVGTARQIRIIDSGWQGSAQSLLADAFPELEFRGLYFGRTLSDRYNPRHASDMVGVVFENDSFNPEVPASAIVLHRHLIETLFEPNGPSIEEVVGDGLPGLAMAQANIDEVPGETADAHYLGVRRYIADHSGTTPIAEIAARSQVAMRQLARMIATPTRAEVPLLSTKGRSADFGREILVPVLRGPEEPGTATAEDRVSQALWPQGQMALEFLPEQALEMQKRSLGLATTAAYFDEHAERRGEPKDTAASGTVAIITRTKNRPILLKRAADSVARQTYTNFEWVIVNDGGNEEAVLDIIKTCKIDPKRITLVSNRLSVGMEAASNLGIRSVDSRFIVIHDDDDSWEAQFLEKTVAYLESPAGRRYGGVITKSMYVSEEIRGDDVVIHGQAPYQDWVSTIQLAEMACNNMFPPIAFLFRRSVYDEIGGFDESLPVLGDWAFNIEFLFRADIGVLHERLANYHHRDVGQREGVYSNSVIGARSKHEEFNAVVRNGLLRRVSRENPAGLAVIFGYLTNELRNQSSQIRGHIQNNPTAEASGPRSQTGTIPSDVVDMLDRRWVGLQLAAAAAKGSIGPKSLFGMRRASPVISPSMSWPEMMKLVIPVPLDPPPDFDDLIYRRNNPDVNASIVEGKFKSGFEHYVKHGRLEGRRRPTIA